MSETMMKRHTEGSSVAPTGGSESGPATAAQTRTDAAAWWQQHDQRVYQCIKLWVEQWYPPQHDALLDAGEMGERGLTGPKGDKGAPGVPQIVSFKLDRERYRVPIERGDWA